MTRAGATSAGASTVGIIVNPHAGKDIRRLVSAAGHTSDSVKIGIMARAVAGAFEQGAERVLMTTDTHHLAERAVHGLSGRVEFVESPCTGSHLDTVAAAREMWKHEAGAVVVLGGDGTCRDVATGWPEIPLIAISTGTNNVYPSTVDGTTAGVAAALIAQNSSWIDELAQRSKRVVVRVDDPHVDGAPDEYALVEAALIDTTFVGARAIADPASIRWVVAALAEPASTGLSSIAGRVHPVGHADAGGVLLRLGPRAHRRVRVPLAPGSFATLDVESVEPLPLSTPVDLPAGGVLAYDGERHTPVASDARVTVSIDRSGPRLIDVDATLRRAAADRRFDLDPNLQSDAARKDHDGH